MIEMNSTMKDQMCEVLTIGGKYGGKYMKSLFPKEILCKIFSYDSTYHDIYKNKVLREIEWGNVFNTITLENTYFMRNMDDVLRNYNLFTVTNIYSKMIEKMFEIVPILLDIGFKSTDFTIGDWYFDEQYHNKSNVKTLKKISKGETNNLYWKTTIHVNLELDNINGKVQEYFQKQREKIRELYGDGGEEDGYESDYTVDSEGFRHRYPSVPPLTWDQICPELHKTKNCYIFTRGNGGDVTTVAFSFYGVKVPI